MSKVKLHFNRVNMQRGDERVWSAHTYKSCNMARDVAIMHGGAVIGRAVFHPDKADNPRAWVEFNGDVAVNANGETVINIG